MRTLIAAIILGAAFTAQIAQAESVNTNPLLNSVKEGTLNYPYGIKYNKTTGYFERANVEIKETSLGDWTYLCYNNRAIEGSSRAGTLIEEPTDIPNNVVDKEKAIGWKWVLDFADWVSSLDDSVLSIDTTGDIVKQKNKEKTPLE